MKESIDVLVVVDEDGVIRPLAGIWKDDEYGNISAEIFLKKNKGVKVVKATITLK